MLRWAPFPFLRFTFFLSAGILAYLAVGQLPVWLPWLLVIVSGISLALFFFAGFQKSSFLTDVTGLTGLLLLFILGFVLTHYRTARHQSANLSRHSGTISHYVGVVDDYIVRKPHTTSTTLRVKAVKSNGTWQETTGWVRLSLKKDTLAPALTYGAILLVKGASQPVQPPLNPGQFNYQRYLANQQVYHQHYLAGQQFKQLGQEPNYALMDWSIRVRNRLDAQLRRYIPAEREYAVGAALLLGIRDALPDDIKANFSRSGTMHVLAVSGLHVAVLFWIINLLLGKWSKRRRFKYFRFIILFSFFGFYAFVTALSPSVLRAVLMFWFLAVADTFRRQTNIYNTLAATAFLLLLINPYYLLDVGFQLSFLALFGIVYFTPKLQSLLTPTAYPLNFAWKMACATVAAQITTLPLTLYYFHQFPVYFLMANLVAITLSNVALIVGLLLLALTWWPAVAVKLGIGLTYLLSFMNQSNAWLLRVPFPVIDGFSLTVVQTWLLYGLLVLLVAFLVRKKLLYFGLFTGLLMCFCGLQVIQTIARNQNNHWVIYHTHRATTLGFVQGKYLHLLADSSFFFNPRHAQYVLQPHVQQAGLAVVSHDTLPNSLRKTTTVPVRLLPDDNWLIHWQGVKIFILRQRLNLESLAQLKPDYILLTQNAYFPVNRWPTELKETRIIIGSANGYRYQQRLEQALAQAGIIYYNQHKNGAYLGYLPTTKN